MTHVEKAQSRQPARLKQPLLHKLLLHLLDLYRTHLASVRRKLTRRLLFQDHQLRLQCARQHAG